MNLPFLTAPKKKRLQILTSFLWMLGSTGFAQQNCQDLFPEDSNAKIESFSQHLSTILIPAPKSKFRAYGLNEADQRFSICSNPECSKINQAKSMITFHQLDKNGYGPYMILVFDRRSLFIWTESSGVMTAVDQNTLNLIQKRLQTLKMDPQFTTDWGQKAFEYMMTNQDINPVYSNH